MGTLGTVGIADKGVYNPSTTYVIGNSVYYGGSTWVAQKDNLTGIIPQEGENWKYLARGFGSDNLTQIEAKDTNGLLGTAGADVVSQELVDAITARVMTQLIPYTNIANNFLATDPKTVLSGPMGKSLKDQLDTTNSNLSNKVDASALNSKLSNDNPNHLTSVGFDATKAVLKASIDGAIYPIPINVFGDNRMVKGLGIYYDTVKGKNVMQVNWWADGVDHTNYISFD